MAGLKGGAGAQGICYNEDGLAAEYRGNLFFCDWGIQTVSRFEIKKAGGTYAVSHRSTLVSKGTVTDFRPFSLAVAADGASLWLVDWAYDGWLADGPRTGRLYRLRPGGSHQAVPRGTADRSGSGRTDQGRSITLRFRFAWNPSESSLERDRPIVPLLADRLNAAEPETGRLHALWALDAIGGVEARKAIGAVLHDPSARVRLQAARSAGIRRDQGRRQRPSRTSRRSRCGRRDAKPRSLSAGWATPRRLPHSTRPWAMPMPSRPGRFARRSAGSNAWDKHAAGRMRCSTSGGSSPRSSSPTKPGRAR